MVLNIYDEQFFDWLKNRYPLLDIFTYFCGSFDKNKAAIKSHIIFR